jgi:phosphopantothenoylcysteine decarboxylase/phosphopantothenate--cysteine ligase
MTDAAREFIGEATFRALTGRAVPVGMFDPASHPLGAHIELAQRADLVCVAPCTANVLAKAAAGLADDLLSTLLLTASCPVLLAPAMNSQMWQHPAVQRNVATLRADGIHFVDPEAGWLSCRQEGVGRMAEPETIASAIEALLAGKSG